MNLRQQRFVAEYLANGGNGTQAAIAAGYSSRRAMETAHDLVRNRQIALALAAAGQKALAPLEITAQWIAEQAASIVLEGKRDRIPALNLLARMFPEFSEKHERVDVQRVHELARRFGLDTDEVLAEAEALVADNRRA